MNPRMASSGVPIVILASGTGSNFVALHDLIEAGKLSAHIRAVVSDQANAPVLERARERGIPVRVVPFRQSIEFKNNLRTVRVQENALSPIDLDPERQKHFLGPVQSEGLSLREQYARDLMEQLQPFTPHFLVLAGFMRILSATVIESFRSPIGYSRIVNIHPSLLPAFPGRDAYAQAYHFGVKMTGATVHLVEEGVDLGPICAQEAFSMEECRSPAEVQALGLPIEHRLFGASLEWILKEEFHFQALSVGRFCVRKN